jgi:hypothetical protein
MREDLLRKSRLRSGDLERSMSSEVMARLPRNFRSLMAGISYHAVGEGRNHHCESWIYFYVGIDPGRGKPRVYELIASEEGPQFVGNKQKLVVEEAKGYLADMGYLAFILGKYAASSSSQK